LLQQCVKIANSDVENFASPDIRDFLGNTWNLMPESTPSLRAAGGLFTIRVGQSFFGSWYVVHSTDGLVYRSLATSL
jgi:hypothetical protein